MIPRLDKLIYRMRIRPSPLPNRRKPPNIIAKIPIILCVGIPRHQTWRQHYSLSEHIPYSRRKDSPGVSIDGGHGGWIKGIGRGGKDDGCVLWVCGGGVDFLVECDEGCGQGFCEGLQEGDEVGLDFFYGRFHCDAMID